jgi:hypothetical protein
MPPSMTATASGRVVCRHPETKGGVVFWLDQLRADESPADHLAFLLATVPNYWPRDGWILTMELKCTRCGETRMIQILPSYKGPLVVCDCCGKAEPYVPPAAGART